MNGPHSTVTTMVVVWSWQATVASIILGVAWSGYCVCMPIYWQKRHHLFFAIRTPQLVVLAATCNLLSVTSISLQCIIESTSYAAAKSGHDPASVPHFPCLVMLFTSVSLYPSVLCVGILRSLLVIVRWDPAWRSTGFMQLTKPRIRARALLSATLATTLMTGVITGVFTRYREAQAGQFCFYQQEWYIYLVIGPIALLSSRKIVQAVTKVHDAYYCGFEIRALQRIMLLAYPYYAICIIFDVLLWSGRNVNRSALELQGLPFDLFSVILHVMYFYFTVVGPLRWFADYSRRLSEESNSHGFVHTPHESDGNSEATGHRRTVVGHEGWSLQRAFDNPKFYAVFAAQAQRMMCCEYTSFWDDYQTHRAFCGRGSAGRSVSQLSTPTCSNVTVRIEKSDDPPSSAVPTDAMKFHMWMCDKYVRNDAPFELNISDLVRKAYVNALQVAGPDHYSRPPTRSPAPISMLSLAPLDERHQFSRNNDSLHLSYADRQLISTVWVAHRSSSLANARPACDRLSSLVFPTTVIELSTGARITAPASIPLEERNDRSPAVSGADVDSSSELSVIFSNLVTEVLLLMETNIWPQVKQSPAFARLLEDRAME